MEDIVSVIKVGLAQHLEKQGSSLEEFEQSLANLNTMEGVSKTANFLESIGNLGSDAVKGIGGMAAKAPELALLSALMVGSAGGAGVYGMGKHMEDQDKKFADKEQEAQRIRSLTDRLKSDYGIH